MGTLALAADGRAAEVEVTAEEVSVRLMDGRTISVPLAWYPRLLNATDEQRQNWRVVGGRRSAPRPGRAVAKSGASC